MSTLRLRPAALALALAVAMVLAIPLLGLTACGLLDDGGVGSADGAPVDDGADESRQLVLSYLEAMKEKDVDAGRAQLCPAMHDAFDQGATGPNGDFADHFTVVEADVVDVRPGDGGQQVSTAITVEADGEDVPAKLMFVVARGDVGWCIADELVGGHEPISTGLPAEGRG